MSKPVPAPRCLLCVHAHPDDEALFTAGVMARYKSEGVRVVLVTCTDGSLGIPPEGSGGERAEVAAVRTAELEASAAILGVDRLELLGYHDSGMAGWPQNDEASAFVKQSLDEVAGRIGAVLSEERPQVVVTYDERGFYGHPDHVFTHRAVMAALGEEPPVDKVYFPAIPATLLDGYLTLAKDMGIVLPEWLEAPDWGAPDELVRTVVDCGAFVAAKHASLAAHASQSDNADLVGLPAELFALVFGAERYIRAFDRTGTPLPEDDLFAGVQR